ncbi:hypothetical protein Tco_0031479 [Tanacetum coccineum]
MDDVGYVIVAQLDVRKDEVDIVMLSFDVHGAECFAYLVVPEIVVPARIPREDNFGCKIFLWKEERVRLLVGSPGASTTLIYSPGSSSTPIYSLQDHRLQFILENLQHLHAILRELQEIQSAQTASTCLIR